MKIEAKNIKTFRGREGEGFNATLYFDGVRACLVDNDAGGGQFRYEWLSGKQNEEKALQARTKVEFLKAHKDETEETLKVKGESHWLDWMDVVVATIVMDTVELASLRRKAAKNALYITPGMKSGMYMVCKTPFSPAVKEEILKRKPDAKFLNENLDNGEWKTMLGITDSELE